MLVPFHHEEDIIGIMLITESNISKDKQIDYLYSNIDALSDFMYESREMFYTKPSGTQYTRQHAEAHTSQLIKKAEQENKHLILIRIETTPLIQHLNTRLDDADEYRLEKDIISLISSMIRGSGELIFSAQGHCILLVMGKSLTKGKIILHQIYNSLNAYFSLDRSPLPSLTSTERLYPRDGETAELLLKDLI